MANEKDTAPTTDTIEQRRGCGETPVPSRQARETIESPITLSSQYSGPYAALRPYGHATTTENSLMTTFPRQVDDPSSVS
jgi:hypothetical protein